MKSLHLLSIVLLLVALVITQLAGAQNWADASIVLRDSSKLNGQLRFRQNMAYREFRIRSNGESRWIDLPQIARGTIEGRSFRVFRLSGEVEEVYALGFPLSTPNWYFTRFQERQCLCNQSYRTTRAYVHISGNAMHVLRKKPFSDLFGEPTFVSRILGLSGDAELPDFSELPEYLQKNPISGN